MVDVLDPTALTGFHEGLFSYYSVDGRVYLITAAGAIPAFGLRYLTTLNEALLADLDQSWLDAKGNIGASSKTPARYQTIFDGRIAGIFHGESRTIWLSRPTSLGAKLKDVHGESKGLALSQLRISRRRLRTDVSLWPNAALTAN